MILAVTEVVQQSVTPLWQTILTSGSSTLLLLVAIKWLVAGQDKLITSLEKERTERINDLDERLQQSEKHTAECNEDRKSIREKFIAHLERLAKLPCLILAFMCLTSCKLSEARRTYSIYYISPSGHHSGGGLTIEPLPKPSSK